MSRLVPGHLVDGVVDGVQVVLLGQLGQLELTGGSAVLSVHAHLQVLLGGIGDHLAQQLGELGGVLGLLQAGLLPVHADLGITLAMGHTGHGQIHTYLGALAFEVGAQAVDDLLADLLGNILAKDLTDAHNVLGGPGLLLGLQGELVTADVTDRALGGGNIAFVNVTANRTYPLLHDRILHNLS